jgi:hypothetical protein
MFSTPPVRQSFGLSLDSNWLRTMGGPQTVSTLRSNVEVTNVSPHGFWLLIGEDERFLPFKVFPWFRDASIAELTNVELPSPHHLYWPDLDVDLAVESIEHPEQYPLVSRARPNRRPKLTPPAVRESKATYGRVKGTRKT